MRSVCGGLDYKDAESHTSSSCPDKCSNNGSNHVSVTGSEDAQESDGDDSGNIHQYLNEASKGVPEPLPLKSCDDEGEVEKNLAKVLFSESVCATTVIIPAIKGSREKHGKSLEKLRVSWAEDVYDPPPSIVSHTRSKKQQPHHHKSKSRDSLKKNGKKGHKGSTSSSSSSSRGSKDKKSSSSSTTRSKHSRDKFGWATQMPIAAASS